MIDIERFSKLAAHALERALLLAEELGHTYLGSEHLLLGLIKEADGVASRLLLAKGLSAEKLLELIRRRIGTGEPTKLSACDMTPRLEGIIARAGQIAHQHSFAVVGTDHLLAALCEDPRAQGFRLLSELSIDPARLAARLNERMELPDLPLQGEKGKGKSKPLPKYAIELTSEAAMGRADPLIGRGQELEAVMSILMRKNKNNPCLIGPPGVGKTVIIEGLAHRIRMGRCPAPLQELRILMLDLAAMLAGTKYRGEFEERLRSLLEEAEKDPNIVLFIDELHLLVGAGAAEGAIDAANILKPSLARGRVKVIGATTAEEYRRHIEKDGALERRFAPIYVQEPSEEDTMEILRGLRPGLEQHHRLELPEETLAAAIRLSCRYMGDRYLPDKAIDLLDEAAGRMQLRIYGEGRLDRRGKLRQKQAELEQLLRERRFSAALSAKEELEQLQILEEEPMAAARLTEGELIALIAEKTGIPLRSDDPEGKALYRGLKERLSQRLLGQEGAIEALSCALLRSRAGLSDPCRPACALLFCGPSGVGKTRLARLLAEALFGKAEALIKYDMGEYAEAHSVARLIGAPPGYIGFDQGGGLVCRMRERPYGIVLFDEIEKAHPDVLNILLGLLDEGRLTDGQGRTADFRNAIIILTSNLGAEASGEEPLGFGAATQDPSCAIRRAVERAFRPEFINRLDGIIPFAPLAPAALEQIAAMELEALSARLKAQGISLRFGADVAAEAARRGYDKKYGARPVRRLIEKEIAGVLAARWLEGKLEEGVLSAAEIFPSALTLVE